MPVVWQLGCIGRDGTNKRKKQQFVHFSALLLSIEIVVEKNMSCNVICIIQAIVAWVSIVDKCQVSVERLTF